MGLKAILKRKKNSFIAKKKAKKRGVIFESFTEIDENTSFEGCNRVAKGTKLYTCKVGYATYFAADSHFTRTSVGRYCSIGPRCHVANGAHPTSGYVSTHPAFYSPHNTSAPISYVKTQKFEEYRYAEPQNKIIVQIGNDVWIGSDVCILGGVTIGDGAIVAAGAVVTTDIEPYVVYGGVPAKKLRDRFTEEQKLFLLDLKWWDKPEAWIKIHSDDFEDIDKLKEMVKNE